MKRRVERAVRLQFAILGVLSQLDYATASDLCEVLNLPFRAIRPSLAAMERDGSIKPVGGVQGLFRLGTQAERRRTEGR